jgi:hypothetical protein
MINNVKKVCLTIVTENQRTKRSAEILAEILVQKLGNDSKTVKIEKYYKFDNSFKIELEFDIIEIDKAKINNCLISSANLIASPWLLYYDSLEQIIKLIYNKNENSRIKDLHFNVIKWGHCFIID